MPVGDALIGRVVDPLGKPLDGKGPVVTSLRRPVESVAPGVAGRQPVDVPHADGHQGHRRHDAHRPRPARADHRRPQDGQDRHRHRHHHQSEGNGVICVYVAIGQKESTVAKIVENLRAAGAMDYTIVVSAAASDPRRSSTIAPYAGCAMAEYFMYEQGRDTLVVYDDLSKQAAAYRQLSLLMRRPPGREAFPGDIFYAHSRLLERSAKLAEKYVIVPGDADDAKVRRRLGRQQPAGRPPSARRAGYGLRRPARPGSTPRSTTCPNAPATSSSRCPAPAAR